MDIDRLAKREALQRLRSLPLVTLYLTDRCNSRCISCDYWRHGRVNMDVQHVDRLVPELQRLGTRTVLISGGEPLIHPRWADIACTLRGAGMQLWLLTSGLSLAKHAARVAELFQSVTVSLDGVDRATYAEIRGVDAFEHVMAGIRAVASAGVPAGVRVTVQRRNFRQLAGIVELALRDQARAVSFLAADVRNGHAFGRVPDFASDIALCADDLPAFARCLDELEVRHAREFSSGFIAEPPHKLRRLWQYYAALCGLGPFPVTHCNAPEFSAVIEADGSVDPCFFIHGPRTTAECAGGRHSSLDELLNSGQMQRLRDDIRGGRRAECEGCVCSMWRELPA
jgi:MoaA/NifB/PqqE/SkfB family radical SAM enzyme